MNLLALTRTSDPAGGVLRLLLSLLLLSGIWARALAEGEPEVPEPLAGELTALYQRWAEVYYQRPAAEREAGMAPIVSAAGKLRERFSARPEPLIMEAVARSAWAEKAGMLTALEQAKMARKLLETAIEIDPLALRGAAWVTLGALYYRVPGWPVGFGDDDRAREYLEKAIRLDPDNVDAYFFLGDFLAGEGEEERAREVWTHGLTRPVREHFPVADAGRRQMIREGLQSLD